MSEGILNTEIACCPACGPGASNVWIAQKDSTRYNICSRCGTVFASPRASHASRYAWLNDTFALDDARIQHINNRRHMLALEAAMIDAYIQGGTLLDVGCSTGAFFDYFDAARWQKFGVELSPSTAAYAAQTYSAEVRAGTLQSAHFPAGAFDLITMIDMFYYEENPQDLLREAARIIRPEGWLVIELPGQAFHRLRGRGLFCWLLDHQWSRFDSRSGYLYWYSPAGIDTLLNQAGFEVTQWEVIGAPDRRGVSQRLAVAYFKLMRLLVKRFPRAISWAPKYFVLAKTRKTGAKIF